MKPNLVIDARGLFCPIPIVKTSEAIKKLFVGGIVEVISDDPAIESDMPAWCKSNGHVIERVSKRGEDFHYMVKRCR